MQPKAHKSHPICGSFPFNTSGATYCAVPTNELRRRTGFPVSWSVGLVEVLVSLLVVLGCEFVVGSKLRILADPKSVSFMWNLSSNNMFSGFKSLKKKSSALNSSIRKSFDNKWILTDEQSSFRAYIPKRPLFRQHRIGPHEPETALLYSNRSKDRRWNNTTNQSLEF